MTPSARPYAVLSGHRHGHELQWMPTRKRVWRWVVVGLAVGFMVIFGRPM